MSRRCKTLLLDLELFESLNVPLDVIVNPIWNSVHINNLQKLTNSLMNGGHIPPDAILSWLYFDLRFNNWSVVIESEQFRSLQDDEHIPLLEIY